MSDVSQDHMRGSVVTGLLKSFVKQHPTMPCLPPLIWNVEVVLYHLANYPPPEKLSFRLLAKKTLTLLLLATTRRRADVLAISVDPRYLDATATRIHTILQRLSKTYSVRRKWVQELTIYKYEQDETICPYTYFIYYLTLSDRFRPKDEEGRPLVTSFFITKEGRPASSETCGNWVREVLSESGIDPNIYTPHSCRSASASYKLAKGYPLEAVLAQGGWASDHAFMKFYRRNIDVCHFKNIQFPACSAQGPEPALRQFDNSQSGSVYGQVSHIWTKYSKFRACNSRSRRHPVLPRYFRPVPLTPMNGLAFLGVHKSPVCSAAVAVPPVDLTAVDCPVLDALPTTSRPTMRTGRRTSQESTSRECSFSPRTGIPVPSEVPVLTTGGQKPLMSPPPRRARPASRSSVQSPSPSRTSGLSPTPSPSSDTVAARTRSRSRSTTPVQVVSVTGDEGTGVTGDVTPQVRRQLDLAGSPYRTAVYSDGEVEFDLTDLDNIDSSELLNCVADIHQDDAELVQIELNDGNNESDWVFTQEIVSTKNVPTAPASVKRVLSPEMFPLKRTASDFSAPTSKSTKGKVVKTVRENTKRSRHSSTGSTASSDSVQIVGATYVKTASPVVPLSHPTSGIQTVQHSKSRRTPRVPKDILPSIEDVSTLLSVTPWGCNLQLPQTHSKGLGELLIKQSLIPANSLPLSFFNVQISTAKLLSVQFLGGSRPMWLIDICLEQVTPLFTAGFYIVRLATDGFYLIISDRDRTAILQRTTVA